MAVVVNIKKMLFGNKFFLSLFNFELPKKLLESALWAYATHFYYCVCNTIMTLNF